MIALGSYSPLLLAPLGIRIPVYPLKGYSVTLPLGPAEAQSAPSVSLSDEAHKIVISRLGERLRAAGTAELTGYDTSVNDVRCAAIARRIRQLFPQLGALPAVENWCGLRPATPSNVPLIGRTRLRNLYLNTGHGTLGWTLACGSARRSPTSSPDAAPTRSPSDLRVRPSESQFVDMRGLRYHVRRWRAPGAPKMVLLHGWMDVSASFQFLVDALTATGMSTRPDWRGYGLTDWGKADCYWFPDYIADLDFLLEQSTPKRRPTWWGTASAATWPRLYAGIRPERVAKLVNLEGFGMPQTRPEQAPKRYAPLARRAARAAAAEPYADFAALAERLQPEQPAAVARAGGVPCAPLGEEEQGKVVLRGDPAHKIVNPVLYRYEEARASWQQVSAPVLWVDAEQSDTLDAHEAGRGAAGRAARRLPALTHETVRDAGHMLHHDQPEAVARLIEEFLAS